MKTPINKVIFIAIICLMMLLTNASAAESLKDFDHKHLLFNKVLNEYVSDGLVDYRALKNNQNDLDDYLQILADIDAKDFGSWTRQQQLALWINAYNAFTIRVILDNYPIEHSWLNDPLGQYPDSSIRQIKGVWKELAWKIMGRKLTLDHMEHVIMRQEIVEPRIHFTLVCASIGCPNLENKAFEASNLEGRLNQAGVNYIYASRKIRIDGKNKVVRLPQIYKWFDMDFEEGTKHKSLFKDDYSSQEAGILSWVYEYANETDRELLVNNQFKLAFLFYDWALNEQL